MRFFRKKNEPIIRESIFSPEVLERLNLVAERCCRGDLQNAHDLLQDFILNILEKGLDIKKIDNLLPYLVKCLYNFNSKKCQSNTNAVISYPQNALEDERAVDPLATSNYEDVQFIQRQHELETAIQNSIARSSNEMQELFDKIYVKKISIMEVYRISNGTITYEALKKKVRRLPKKIAKTIPEELLMQYYALCIFVYKIALAFYREDTAQVINWRTKSHQYISRPKSINSNSSAKDLPRVDNNDL